MKITFTLTTCLAVLTLMLSGCAGLRKALGMSKTVPDEFAIVTKAPLSVPPDFALRPPKPGKTRPNDVTPSDRVRSILVGDSSSPPPSQGELLLMAYVGAADTPENIRNILGAENGGHITKEENFANRILFWQVKEGVLDTQGAPLVVEDPEQWLASRDSSIKSVTGGEVVIIDKSTSSILNLPGIR